MLYVFLIVLFGWAVLNIISAVHFALQSRLSKKIRIITTIAALIPIAATILFTFSESFVSGKYHYVLLLAIFNIALYYPYVKNLKSLGLKGIKNKLSKYEILFALLLLAGNIWGYSMITLAFNSCFMGACC